MSNNNTFKTPEYDPDNFFSETNVTEENGYEEPRKKVDKGLLALIGLGIAGLTTGGVVLAKKIKKNKLRKEATEVDVQDDDDEYEDADFREVDEESDSNEEGFSEDSFSEYYEEDENVDEETDQDSDDSNDTGSDWWKKIDVDGIIAAKKQRDAKRANEERLRKEVEEEQARRKAEEAERAFDASVKEKLYQMHEEMEKSCEVYANRLREDMAKSLKDLQAKNESRLAELRARYNLDSEDHSESTDKSDETADEDEKVTILNAAETPADTTGKFVQYQQKGHTGKGKKSRHKKQDLKPEEKPVNIDPPKEDVISPDDIDRLNKQFSSGETHGRKGGKKPENKEHASVNSNPEPSDEEKREAVRSALKDFVDNKLSGIIMNDPESVKRISTASDRNAEYDKIKDELISATRSRLLSSGCTKDNVDEVMLRGFMASTESLKKEA